MCPCIVYRGVIVVLLFTWCTLFVCMYFILVTWRSLYRKLFWVDRCIDQWRIDEQLECSKTPRGWHVHICAATKKVSQASQHNIRSVGESAGNWYLLKESWTGHHLNSRTGVCPSVWGGELAEPYKQSPAGCSCAIAIEIVGVSSNIPHERQTRLLLGVFSVDS